MFWASLACLNAFINSVVWRDNVADSAPAWCDVCEYTVMTRGSPSSESFVVSNTHHTRSQSCYSCRIALHTTRFVSSDI
jgi:pheromone a factor receptor